MSRSSTKDFSGVTSEGSMPVTSSMISAMPAMISSWVVATMAPSNWLLLPTGVGMWLLLPRRAGSHSPSELGEPIQVSGGLDGLRRYPPKFAFGNPRQSPGRRELHERRHILLTHGLGT